MGDNLAEFTQDWSCKVLAVIFFEKAADSSLSQVEDGIFPSMPFA